jgi:hypothetical protein
MRSIIIAATIFLAPLAAAAERYIDPPGRSPHVTLKPPMRPSRPMGMPWASDESRAPKPEAFGTAGMPFSTGRVDTLASYAPTGRLWITFPTATDKTCTASLIAPSVVVTAAHCVQFFGIGERGRSSAWRFVPAAFGPDGPYGEFVGIDVAVAAPFAAGTDTCHPEVPAVICNNDIAVIALAKRGGQRAGDVVGHYAYAANGYSFVTSQWSPARFAAVTRVGYPTALNNGRVMMASTGPAYEYINGSLRNTLMGSDMGPGSSGGPWIVNCCADYTLSGTGSRGKAAARNRVIGVTSYVSGDDDPATSVNQAGASWFGQNKEYPLADYGGYGPGNIGDLMRRLCSRNAADVCQ